MYVHASMRVSLQKWSLFRNSLAVQWLALSTFTAEGLVQSLIRELRSHKLRGVGKGKEKKWSLFIQVLGHLCSREWTHCQNCQRRETKFLAVDLWGSIL